MNIGSPATVDFICTYYCGMNQHGSQNVKSCDFETHFEKQCCPEFKKYVEIYKLQFKG
jgi:hypothetical protein